MEVGFREIFLATFYTILLIFGFTGNSMVLAVVYRNKNRKMRSISNIFIVSMSASDIMILVSHLPYLIYNLFEKKWLATGIFGHVICGIFKLLVYLSTDVSMLSLAIVAADRFWAIYHPTRQRITARIAKKIIIGCAAKPKAKAAKRGDRGMRVSHRAGNLIVNLGKGQPAIAQRGCNQGFASPHQ